MSVCSLIGSKYKQNLCNFDFKLKLPYCCFNDLNVNRLNINSFVLLICHEPLTTFIFYLLLLLLLLLFIQRPTYDFTMQQMINFLKGKMTILPVFCILLYNNLVWLYRKIILFKARIKIERKYFFSVSSSLPTNCYIWLIF